jgi:rubrerythrin
MAMAVLQRLSRWIIGGTSAEEAVQALMQCYCDCATRASRLARHAEMAPHPGAAERLAELAATDERHAKRLADAIVAAGRNLPTVPQTLPARGTMNYWGRLVWDLEAHRLAVKQLRDLVNRLAEELPDSAALFDELRRGEMAHCQALRALIARADPQALN